MSVRNWVKCEIESAKRPSCERRCDKILSGFLNLSPDRPCTVTDTGDNDRNLKSLSAASFHE